MDDLIENEAFQAGLDIGFHIYQQMVLNAFERREPLMIDREPYYIQSGDELLQQMLDEVCNG